MMWCAEEGLPLNCYCSIESYTHLVKRVFREDSDHSKTLMIGIIELSASRRKRPSSFS